MILSKMADTMDKGLHPSLAEHLKKESEMLEDLERALSSMVLDASLRLSSFYEDRSIERKDNELLKTVGLAKTHSVIVDSKSAYLGVAKTQEGLSADHFGLNKFASSKDGDYERVSEEIRTIMRGADGILKTRQRAARQKLVDDPTKNDMLNALAKGFVDVSGTTKGPDPGSKTSSVTDMDSFKSWKEQDEMQLLWIHGKAGAGQDAAASAAIQELLKSSGTGGSIVTSFFCDQSDMQRRSFKGLLQMIIHQCIMHNQDLATHLLSESGTGTDIGKRGFYPEATLKTTVLWDALYAMAKDLPGVRISGGDMRRSNIYVVIYGLDQLSQESLQEALSYFSEFPDKETLLPSQSETPRVKWMILSRSGRQNISKGLHPKALEVDLGDAENLARLSSDLRAYISASVNDLALPSSLAYFAKRHIHSRAEDNYIYVKLVVQELRNKWKPGKTQHAEIRKLLESFPYGLTNMFEHIQKRVLETHAKEHEKELEYTKEILRSCSTLR